MRQGGQGGFSPSEDVIQTHVQVLLPQSICAQRRGRGLRSPWDEEPPADVSFSRDTGNCSHQAPCREGGPPAPLTRVFGLPSKQSQCQASLDVFVPVDGRSNAGKDLGVGGGAMGTVTMCSGLERPCTAATPPTPH